MWRWGGWAGEGTLVDSQQLGWGIVGPGRIAATQIAAAPNSTLISVVSRDLGRATEFA